MLPGGEKRFILIPFFKFYAALGLIEPFGHPDEAPGAKLAPGLQAELSGNGKTLAFRAVGIMKLGQMPSGPIPSSLKALMMRCLCHNPEIYDYMGRDYDKMLQQFLGAEPLASSITVPLA